MRRRLLGASIALAVMTTALLAGCAAIPTSGPVTAGDPASVEEALELDIIVDPPQPDASQEDILNGFIEAAQSPRGNYQVARQYLAPEFAEEWQPGAAATVDVRSDRRITPVDATSMQVQAAPVASVTGAGQYDVQDPGTPIDLTYRFTEVDGQWRIYEAPPGILIDEIAFAQVFRQHPLYFFDPEYRYLVPDLRWFAGFDSVQTSIVNALLAGPSDWLGPGVVSAFPDGVRLSPAAVPVAGRVASVNLAGAAFDDVVTVQLMQAQLKASLQSVRSIDEVALSLDGAVQEVSPLTPSPSTNPRVDPRPVVYDGTSFGHLATSGEGVDPIAVSAQVEALVPTGVGVGADGASAAVRNAAGVSLVRADEETVLLDPRENLVVPAIDGAGVVWSVPADAPGELVWYRPDGTPGNQIAAPWSGETISAIEVSRDGTRIVALLGDGARTHFIAASISRDADGLPVEIGPVPLILTDVAGKPLDVAWVDANTVASLTALPGGATRLVTQELGGTSSVRQGPAGGVGLDGGNSARDVRVLTAAGDLDAQSGVGWQVRASGILLVAEQQPR